MFSLKKKTLRNRNIDNSVKDIPKSEKNQKRKNKPKVIENNSIPRKQDKVISQNNKKFV